MLPGEPRRTPTPIGERDSVWATRIREPKPATPQLTDDDRDALEQVRRFLLATDPK